VLSLVTRRGYECHSDSSQSHKSTNRPNEPVSCLGKNRRILFPPPSISRTAMPMNSLNDHSPDRWHVHIRDGDHICRSVRAETAASIFSARSVHAELKPARATTDPEGRDRSRESAMLG